MPISCPNCHCRHSRVIQTRKRGYLRGVEKIVREVECQHCYRRYRTVENLEPGEPGSQPSISSNGHQPDPVLSSSRKSVRTSISMIDGQDLPDDYREAALKIIKFLTGGKTTTDALRRNIDLDDLECLAEHGVIRKVIRPSRRKDGKGPNTTVWFLLEEEM